MRNSLKVLLVAALVAPVLFLAGCNCGGCEKTYDKCGMKYDSCDK